MRKNSHTPSAQSGVTAGTAPDTSRTLARPRPDSAPRRFTRGFLLKQMPLRIQLKTAKAIIKKTVVDSIKKADRSSSNKGKPIDLSGRNAQRDNRAAYPASNVQSDS